MSVLDLWKEKPKTQQSENKRPEYEWREVKCWCNCFVQRIKTKERHFVKQVKGLSASEYILRDDPDTEPVSLKENDKDIKDKIHVGPPFVTGYWKHHVIKNSMYYQKSSRACKQPESDG